MFIPISTDAPIYYFPWATLSLIGANVVTFIMNGVGALPGGGSDWPLWALHFGSGLHPLEWITNHFVHFGIMHLAGNMLFLWVFGLVVEGKIGWWRFLLVYLGVGVVQAAIVQTLMLASSDPRPAGGASGVVYGLMAISVIWAPKNEVSIFALLWYRGIYFEMSILALAAFYLVMQVAFAALSGFAMSSEVLHLLGAGVGFGIGIVMLRRHWVDCENWDLFAVMGGTHGAPAVSDDLYYRDQARQARLRERRHQPAADPLELEGTDPDQRDSARIDKIVRKLTHCLDGGKPAAALAEYRRALKLDPNYQLARRDLYRLIEGLSKARLWNEVGPLLERSVDEYPDDPRLRLKLAALLVEIKQRPRHALRVLQGLPESHLDDRLARRRVRIETRANDLIDDGVLELEAGKW